MTKPFAHPRYDQILARIEPLRQQLLTHALYRRLETLEGLRVFLENHIFAVWDFMSLLKTLQRHLCGLDVPWQPADDTTATRLINEIVLGEESDEDGSGGFVSHFELYRRAMRECGADTGPIDDLLADLSSGSSVDEAIRRRALPSGTANFVRTTFDIIASGSLPQVAAAFTLGREDLLPGLFQRMVDELNESHGGALATLQYYLRRHIELDGEQHGPMAARLVAAVCGEDEEKWNQAEQSALRSLQARLQLWDNIAALIPDSILA